MNLPEFGRIKEVDLIRQLYACNRCGYCRSVCPTFSEIKWEGASPRGRIYYIKKILEGKIKKIDQTFIDRVFQCALCERCDEVCQQSIQHTSLWKAMRAELGARGLWPENLKRIVNSLATYKNAYQIPNEERTFWAFTLDDVVMRARATELVMSRFNKKAEVLYFIGCVASFSPRMASIPESLVRIMDAAGVDYTMLGEEEWCCADPLLMCMLDPKGSPSIEEFVEHNIQHLQKLDIETLVTACAGCYRAFKKDYPKILGQNLEFEVLHETEFLERLIDNNKLKLRKKFNKTLTYHDPCEIGRQLGVYEAPRKVIENIPGVTYNELIKTRKHCNCCGGGGLLEATNPELATKIASRKLDEAQEVGAEIISSCCPACEINLMNAVGETKAPLEIFDISEIVASTL